MSMMHLPTNQFSRRLSGGGQNPFAPIDERLQHLQNTPPVTPPSTPRGTLRAKNKQTESNILKRFIQNLTAAAKGQGDMESEYMSAVGWTPADVRASPVVPAGPLMSGPARLSNMGMVRNLGSGGSAAFQGSRENTTLNPLGNPMNLVNAISNLAGPAIQSGLDRLPEGMDMYSPALATKRLFSQRGNIRPRGGGATPNQVV